MLRVWTRLRIFGVCGVFVCAHAYVSACMSAYAYINSVCGVCVCITKKKHNGGEIKISKIAKRYDYVTGEREAYKNRKRPRNAFRDL